MLRVPILRLFSSVRQRLSQLSFRTGIIVLLGCIPFYVLSFAQALLPNEWISPAQKVVLWAILYGCAKSFQYAGLAILGKEGWQRIKRYWKQKRSNLS